jgi:type VI secretion system secreted protein Hcp
MALFDAFLKIDGINGESTSQGHEKWIELLSFSWGATNSSPNAASGGGGGAGKVSPQAFSFMKATDSASPQLFLKCCTGEHFKKVSLACRKAGGESPTAGDVPDDFLKLDLYDVIVSSYNEGGNPTTPNEVPMESLSLNFLKIEFDFVAPPNTDGNPGGFSSAAFDFKMNRAG